MKQWLRLTLRIAGVAILIAAVTCIAQSKRAETSLAGITIGAPLAEVRRMVGTPERIVDTPTKEVAWRAGEREYYFDMTQSEVKIVEDYYQKPGMQSEHSSGVLSISVQGNSSSIKTGLGLSLGDSVKTINQLYGRAPLVKQHIQIHWTNGNILDIDLDPQGKVKQIELSLNQE